MHASPRTFLGRAAVVLFVASAIGACAASEPFRRKPKVDLDERALNLWQSIRSNDAAQMGRDFDPRVEKLFDRRARADFLEGVRRRYGRPEEMQFPRRLKKYEGVYRLKFENGTLEMRLATNEAFAVIGLTIGPPRAAELPVAKTAMRLPLDGALLALSPGPEALEAPAFGDGDPQRFAVDFAGVDPSGRTRIGAAAANESYPCFGRKVLAPADGVVTEAIDGVRDNRPGEPNAATFLGNALAIQLGPTETVVLAHLRNGSVRVKRGQSVKRGQWIAQCGNSGGSLEPRLRLFVQDQPRMAQGKPIQAKFDGATRFASAQLDAEMPERVSLGAAGQRIEGYVPARGDVVESPGTRARAR